MERVARIFSIVLGPQFWLPVILVTTLLKSVLSFDKLIVLFLSLFILQFFIPIFYLVIALKLGKVSSWDLPKRQERYLFLFITFLSFLISLILIYKIGNNLLFHLSLIELSLLIVLAIITLFWKISLHTSLNTLGSIIINFLFSWQLPFIFLSIPIITWARYKLKKHTINQLLAGIIISAFITLSLLSYFKYI